MIDGGTVLRGRYRLDVRIGGGGMGEVWRGQDLFLERTVALKILQPALMDEPGFAQRFRNEAQAMATIRHPGVAEIYDYGSSPQPEGGEAGFLVMEYVDGEPLDRLLQRQGKISPVRTMQLVAQVAETLHAAHVAGVIHRDVKPSNLLVRADDSVVLTDFGIAKSLAGVQLTAKGMVLGTATYCAPEQAAGRPLTPAADVYALGVVAYQCIGGAPPFSGPTPVQIALQHVRDAPPPLAETVPEAVRQVIARAMAKDPDARWASGNAFALAASTAARHPTGSFPAVPLAAADARPYGNPSPAVPDEGSRPDWSMAPGRASGRSALHRRLGLAVLAAVTVGVLGTAGAMVVTENAQPAGETVDLRVPPSGTRHGGANPGDTPTAKTKKPTAKPRSSRRTPRPSTLVPSNPVRPTEKPRRSPSESPDKPSKSPTPTPTPSPSESMDPGSEPSPTEIEVDPDSPA